MVVEVVSWIVRPHQHAADGKGRPSSAPGRSRGGLTGKLHLPVRGLGCPTRSVLTAGQAGDADGLRKAITATGAVAVIPDNPSQAVRLPLDRHPYRNAIYLVEGCISKPGQVRRAATRYEQPARNHLAIVTTFLWIR
jgi:hypothetical protein